MSSALQLTGGRRPRRLATADRIRTSEGIRPIVFDRHNERVKVYEIESADEIATSSLIGDAERRGYTKVIAYARGSDPFGWNALGFLREGTIRRYFADGSDATIQSYFVEPRGSHRHLAARHDEHIEIARACGPSEPTLAEGCICRPAGLADAEAIASLMEQTFPEYPEPISSEWVAASIEEGARHFRVARGGSGALLAAASAEVDPANRSAELTDCATRPEARGRGLMRFILRELETDMAEIYGIADLYTLARSDEPAMNCAFAKLGWSYTGRLVDNCRMPNGWESMNIWCNA